VVYDLQRELLNEAHFSPVINGPRVLATHSSVVGLRSLVGSTLRLCEDQSYGLSGSRGEDQMKQGNGRIGAHPARPKMVGPQGSRDPFWRKGEAMPVDAPDDASQGLSGLSTPEDIADWIAKRAYEFYEARGKSDGQDQADWFRAETEISDFMTRVREEEEGKDPPTGP
jgi:hypothetical protein